MQRLARGIFGMAAWVMAAFAVAAGPYEGEVRRVDKSAAKVTIRHGPLAQLDMPPMTMVFQVRDRGWLDLVKPGDKVRFDAEKSGGAYVVTHIEVVQ